MAAVVAAVGGESRPSQQQMAEAVAKAITDKTHLLVQAGTGTGKSVAYLVPALLHAIEQNTCVVVSTATLALQQQLVGRDLPRIAAALAPVLGREPVFAVAKGRHHYICKLRLNSSPIVEDDADEQAVLFKSPSTALGKEVKRVRTWGHTTDTGDREELEPSPDPRVWQALSVAGNECIGAAKCRFGDECFAEKVRADAQAADLVVTNHAMLIIHKLDQIPLLPEHSVVIVDEGHELSDWATNSATHSLSPWMIDAAARKVRKALSEELALDLDEAATSLRLLFEEVSRAQPRRLVLDPVEYGEDAAEQYLALKAVIPAVAEVRDVAMRALTAIAAEQKRDGEADSEILAMRSAARVALTELAEVAAHLLKVGDHDVAWLERSDRGNAALRIAPLAVAHLLSEHLFEQAPVIVTSATLTLGGSFDAIAKGLGLVEPDFGLIESSDDDFSDIEYDEDGKAIPPAKAAPTQYHQWDSLDVGTPFDVNAQGVLYVAAHLPPPGRDGLSDAQLSELERLIVAAGGRTLALFSSWRAVDKAAERLKVSLPAAGLHVKLLVQQRGNTVADLVKQFANDTTSVLLGTVSLWQGVDVPGESCSLVVIDRIPFPRPDEPLFAARQQRVDRAGGRGFMSVAVPRAALLLAQGAGRLLRTQNDRGMVAVLDSRLATAPYANFLLQSMPPFWRTNDPDVATAAIARLGNRLSS